jgi:magnesium-transporting ATPase (P-type)
MFNDPTPFAFEPGILTFYILCLVLYAIVFVFTYSFYKNAKMKVYNKLRYRPITYVLLVFVVTLLFVGSLIVTLLRYSQQEDLFIKNLYMIPMSWTLFGLASIHLLIMLFIKWQVNKHKKAIGNFRNENFQKLLEELEHKSPDESYISRFKVKHSRYFSKLEQSEKIINLSIEKYHPENYEQTLLNIIIFNDNYTTRWSEKMNYFQLKIFYDLCLKLQKKVK